MEVGTTNAPPVFAGDDDLPIPYIERTHEYYLALGYANPYRCAVGSWGGRRPSTGGYDTGTGATSGEPAAGGR